jgi:hypothetical protein
MHVIPRLINRDAVQTVPPGYPVIPKIDFMRIFMLKNIFIKVIGGA